MVEAVDAAFGVDGEDGLVVAFFAEWGDFGVECASEVGEGAGEVESGEWVDVEGGGGDFPAGAGGGDVESAEFGPGFDGGGEEGVAVAGGGDMGAQGVGPVFGLFDVPAAGLPAGFAQGGVDGDGEACGVEVGHGGGVQPFWAVGSTGRTPKWASMAVQERQGAA